MKNLRIEIVVKDLKKENSEYKGSIDFYSDLEVNKKDFKKYLLEHFENFLDKYISNEEKPS